MFQHKVKKKEKEVSRTAIFWAYYCEMTVTHFFNGVNELPKHTEYKSTTHHGFTCMWLHAARAADDDLHLVCKRSDLSKFTDLNLNVALNYVQSVRS